MTATAPNPSASPRVARLHYHGTGSALLGILLKNGLLSIVTVGIYSFWGRNKVRQFHYSNTEVDRDRFTWHGTGGELFVGYLKFMGVALAAGVAYFLAIMAATWLAGKRPGPVLNGVFVVGFYVMVWLVMLLAINGARRYRFSRSSLRGVRFSFEGEAEDYIVLMVSGTLLSVVTLGFYGPWFAEKRRAFLVTNARFGSEPFLYREDPKPLFRQYLKAVLLTIPTLGLSWVWYSAYRHRHQWSHTTMRGARFQSRIVGGALLKLSATNVLLLLLTLGIGAPWLLTRTMAFHLGNLALMGTVDWAGIAQGRHVRPGVAAEGAVDSMNLDVGIGL